MGTATINVIVSRSHHIPRTALLPNDNCAKGYGGEQISLAIQSKVTNHFSQAGYAMIQTNKTHVGGFVRQYGNLSFSRILQAGHEGELRIECFDPDM